MRTIAFVPIALCSWLVLACDPAHDEPSPLGNDNYIRAGSTPCHECDSDSQACQQTAEADRQACEAQQTSSCLNDPQHPFHPVCAPLDVHAGCASTYADDIDRCDEEEGACYSSCFECEEYSDDG